MKKFTFLLFATMLAINAYSAFLKNVPVDLKQPDGTVIHCFVTGDEFHRRVHDKDNYTIIQNPATGYYVYALLHGSELLPSGYILGRVDVKTLPIRAGYDISGIPVEERSKFFLKSGKSVAENPTKGDFNNIVVSIRFADQSPTALTVQDYENKFNSISSLSLKSYYKEVSNSQLNITSYFFPKPQNQMILEYQDSHPRDYYSIYNESDNPIGYKNNEGMEREQTLLKNAIEFVKNQVVETQVNFDANNDGIIDNIVFLFQGVASSWGNVIWPMTSSLQSTGIYIGNKQAGTYNKQVSAWLNVDIISHEFFHSLGAPDLYRYSNKEIDPAGAWDIMGITGAQQMTAFMKWKYGKWFTTIPEITKPGTYTLKPLARSPYACYKIPSPFSATEYFMVEYRKREGLLEGAIPANYNDGLIIYRINTLVPWGDAGGPPDELYIYRPDGNSSRNGDLTKASFSANSGRTTFNTDTNPSCLLSNGDPGGIDISNVSTSGDEISFTVNTVNPLPKPQNLKATAQNGKVLLSWNSPAKKGYTFLGYNVFLEGINLPVNQTLITDSTYQCQLSGDKLVYVYNLVAEFKEGKSDAVSCKFYNTDKPSVLDSLVLVTLYNQCNGSSWSNNRNWLKGPINTWEGVTVTNQRVTKLDLLNNEHWTEPFGLKNSLPIELGYLTELQIFQTAYNQLSGKLPGEIGKLKKLTILSVFNSNLSGSIPPELGNLSNLEQLDLSNNMISGSIPVELCSLLNLKKFSLANNQLSGSIPTQIGNLINLNQINLSINQLSGNIPKELGNIKTLEFIDMPYNELTGDLPPQLFLLPKLKTLSLDVNKLSGQLPKEIGNLKMLTTLGLGDNNLSGPLPEEIWQMTELTFLNLAGKIDGGNLTGIISPKVGNLKKLSSLQLQFNQFSGPLPKELGLLQDMTFLWLSNNQFSGEIPKEIGQLTKLWAFRIDNNHFEGTVPLGFALFSNNSDINLGNNELDNLPDLSPLKTSIFINASFNKFTFEDIEPNMNIVFQPGCTGFHYLNQAKIGKAETITVPVNKAYKLSIYCGGQNNRYQWFKNGLAISEIQSSPDFLLNPVIDGNNGEFFCRVTNTKVPDLTIESYPVTLIGANTLIANAGYDFTIDEGSLGTLTGSDSYNPKGASIIYKWTGPAGITLSAINVPNPTFIAPNVNKDTAFTFSLVVNDGTTDSPADQVTITVKNKITIPVANAGIDQTVNEEAIVTLDGSASSNSSSTPLLFKWTAPEGIVLSSTTDAKPTFVAPDVKQNTPFTFTLVVNNGDMDSQADQVVVLVKQVNKVPVAYAGSDRTVNEKTSVFLDGSASFDPEGNNLIYKWTAPTGIRLNATSIAKPYFLAPDVAKDTTFQFTLVVNDGLQNSLPALVRITVKQINNAPEAWAGVDQTVNKGTIVTLDGTGSTDPDKDVLTFKWTAPAGITLNSTTVAQPVFIAPEVTKDTPFIFSLIVNDGTVNSLPALVNIIILNAFRVGVTDLGSSLLKVYPNPTTGIVNIEISGGTVREGEVVVTNLVGAEVFRKEKTDIANLQIDLSNQVNGIYMLKVLVENQQYISKIIVRK